MTPVVSRAAAGWAAVVSRFPCQRGRGPPREEPRLACIPITAFRLSPASTLRAAPHASDRHSYRNAYAISQLIMAAASGSRSGLIPESAPHPPGGWTRRPHPAEATFRQAGKRPDQDTEHSAAALRTGPPKCRRTSPAALAILCPGSQSEPRNAAHRHEGSPFLHSASPAPDPDRKQQPRRDPRRPGPLASCQTYRPARQGSRHPWL